MALPTILGIVLPGIAVPVIASWMAGDIKFGVERKINEESIRKIAIASMAGIGAASLAYLFTRPAVPSAVVRVSRPVAKTERPIKLTAPVSVGFETHPVSEFYSGASPYPESQHIYVD